MSETKHTLGPWVPQDSRCRVEASIWTADGIRCVAQMVRSEDAPLIAAAPDLLAACRYIVEAGESGDEVTAIEKARAAIAKAEGR